MSDHPAPAYWEFLDIPQDSTTIWRYRSFPQFMSILEYEQLWLSRIDQFKDHYEATVTEQDAELIIQTHEALSEEHGIDQDHLENAGENWRKSLYTNCWHERQIESASMWDIYSRKGQAVAIKSTVGDFLDAIAAGGGVDTDGHIGDINLGRVEYIDFETDRTGTMQTLRPFYKRESFKHEQEVRMVLHYTHVDQTPEEDNVIRPDYSAQPPGIPMNISTDELISEVKISPWADGWFVDLVKDVAETYGIDSASKSDLSGEPNVLL